MSQPSSAAVSLANAVSRMPPLAEGPREAVATCRPSTRSYAAAASVFRAKRSLQRARETTSQTASRLLEAPEKARWNPYGAFKDHHSS